ncbi:MAG: phosphatase, partial [Clostridium sp.]
KAGLKGIELYHISHTDEDKINIRRLAAKYNLFETGGSDFHGAYGEAVELGSYLCKEKSLEKILC